MAVKGTNAASVAIFDVLIKFFHSQQFKRKEKPTGIRSSREYIAPGVKYALNELRSGVSGP